MDVTHRGVRRILYHFLTKKAIGVKNKIDAADSLGIHNVFRYLFDIPTGAITNPPLLSITFDASGRVVIAAVAQERDPPVVGRNLLCPPPKSGEGRNLLRPPDTEAEYGRLFAVYGNSRPST